jgi:hypothetical protein
VPVSLQADAQRAVKGGCHRQAVPPLGVAV